MDPISRVKLRWLHGALHDVTNELARSHFPQYARRCWQPSINAYRCEKCVRICVDLAGVERDAIDLTVEPRRVLIRGIRELPEPVSADDRTVQLLAMEIDYGAFERDIRLPVKVDINEVAAEQ